ncbi:unnamed protein product [Polarella glacialis]|uniref:Amine oxidase domain-containing protein n=1 Tax=Polarella glacialis TaxID=89957 RepID=A0A813EDY8_POLGL|nr:unnamed protein product [Polarella glacialis]CAE8725534.1 unnamed protein product [Polarella glacialis]
MGTKSREADAAQPDADVLIIGAGLAGLTAARILTAFGSRALVVEARDRLGGRASTGEFPAAPELGIPEASPVEEGCNYLHGCSSEHPLFVMAHRLGLPTAVAAGDIGCQYGGWESSEVAEWRDPAAGGEIIPLEEMVDAVLLLQQVVYGVGSLTKERQASNGTAVDSDSSENSDEESEVENEGAGCGGGGMSSSAPVCATSSRLDELPEEASLEDLFERALADVLERRFRAGRRASASLEQRERDLIYKIRGRHFGYVAPCRRMPPFTVSASCRGKKRCTRIFMDGNWPHSDPALVQGMLRLLRKKFSLIQDLGDHGPEGYVADVPEDDGEDRLVLGGGFQTFISALSEGLTVITGDPVRRVESGAGDVALRLASGRVLRAPCALVTVPSGVLVGLSKDSAIEFLPSLPADKMEAIRRLSISEIGACTHEKVVLRWPLATPFVTSVLDQPGAPLQIETTDRRFHFLNLHKYGRAGQILCHIWADAEWKEHTLLSDEAVVAAVVDSLRAIYPKSPSHAVDSKDEAQDFLPFPVQWKVTRWAQDPFALGAYSELQGPGASEVDRQVYARPEGRLLFTGEGAVSGPVGAQCTHGAVLGGAACAVALLTAGSSSTAEPSADARTGTDGETEKSRASELLGSGPLGLDVAAVVDVLVSGRPRPKRRRSAS